MNELKAMQFKNGAYLGVLSNGRGAISVYSYFTRKPNIYHACNHFQRMAVQDKEVVLDVAQVKDEAEWDATAITLAQVAILVE